MWAPGAIGGPSPRRPGSCPPWPAASARVLVTGPARRLTGRAGLGDSDAAAHAFWMTR
jgi:hypothetical protein